MSLHANILDQDKAKPISSDQALRELCIVLETIHDNVTQSDIASLMTCREHSDANVSHYCGVCERMICGQCSKSFHGGHVTEVMTLQQLHEQCRSDVIKKKQDLEIRVDQLSFVNRGIDSTVEEIRKNKDAAMSVAIDSFDRIQRELNRRRCEAIDEIEEEFTKKTKMLIQQQNDVTKSINDVNLPLNILKEIYADDSNNVSITEGSSSVNHVRSYVLYKHLTRHLESPCLRHTTIDADLPCDDYAIQRSYPCQDAFFKWKTMPEPSKLLSCIKATKIGRVLAGHAVARASCLSGECVKSRKCAINRENTVMVETRNAESKLAASDESELEVSVRSCCSIRDEEEVASSKLTAMSGRNADVQCKVKFLIKQLGEYELSARVHGKHARHSPCVMTCLAKKAYLQPEAGLRSSHSLVTNLKNNSMKKPPRSTVSSAFGRELLMTIGSRGRSPGQFTIPQDVAVDPSGFLYVTDSSNSNVQVFKINLESEGHEKYWKKIGEKGRGNGQICRPTGVCVLPGAGVAVSDFENKVVNVYGQDGRFETKIGHGRLLGPRGVCVSKNNQLIVVDNKQCKIFVFHINGKLIRKFGSQGTNDNQLTGPQYAAVNQRDEIFITDFYNHSVKVFTSSGEYLKSFGSKGEGCGQFNAPTGICVDHLNHVIVSDWGNSRVQIFHDDGSFFSYIRSKKAPLYGPQGVAVADKSHFAVADSGNQVVKIYDYLN